MMNLHTDCDKPSDIAVPQCISFTALCVQCTRKTYSLDRGEAHNTRFNHITCHDCPVGGDCVDGQVTSKPLSEIGDKMATDMRTLTKYGGQILL